MKKLLCALGFVLALGGSALAQGQVAGPPNAILCNQAAKVGPTSSVSMFTAITSVTGQTIYLCGWHVTATSVGAAYFQISQGDCASANTTMTPSLSVTNTAPATDHIDYAAFSTSASAKVCFSNSTANTSMSAVLWFSQF